MQFWKMNGAGNDFIILNNLQEGLSADCFPALARRLCERRLSIGADGLMVVERPQSGGDYRMLFYNSDGSAGEMCGNGARCICRYGYEIGLAGELQGVETTAGLVTGRRITRRQYKIELNRPTTLRLDYPDLSLLLCGAGRSRSAPRSGSDSGTARPAGGGAVRPGAEAAGPPRLPQGRKCQFLRCGGTGADLGAHL